MHILGDVLARRAAGLLLLAALLWAPFAPLAALTRDTPSCGMKCCARMKKCCCKGEKHQPGAASAGPVLKAAPSCPRDCLQSPVSRPLVASPLPLSGHTGSSAAAPQILWTSPPHHWTSEDASYASHPRPPPIATL